MQANADLTESLQEFGDGTIGLCGAMGDGRADRVLLGKRLEQQHGQHVDQPTLDKQQVHRQRAQAAHSL